MKLLAWLRRYGQVSGRAIACLALIWFSWIAPVQSGPLAERFNRFPQWSDKPPVQSAQGDLTYPDWFEGDWTVTSTLVDLVAPLAPAIVTPGFDRNRQQLHQPLTFRVRFQRAAGAPVVADRSFNGLNLARASLGDRTVLAVKTDPANPNRQITILRGDRQLISTVKGRAVETLDAEQFITTELFQQVFRGTAQPYLNEVESTTAYHYYGSQPSQRITADQVTAIYLSPQDPDYFKAHNQPVALYRYQLELLSDSKSRE